MAAIELIGISRPVDYQLSSGSTLRVYLSTQAVELDFHVAHVGLRANSTVTASEGWVFRHREATGTTREHIAQEVWTYSVNEGENSPESVVFSFSSFQGEKWVGVHTFRGVDLSDPVADIGGRTTNDMTVNDT